MNEITIYADGCCLGNPGPMGIGAVLLYEKAKREISQAKGNGTNNRAEMLAVIEGVRAVKKRPECQIQVFTDSQLTVKVLSGEWNPSKNLDLVEEAQELINECGSFQIQWVRGHNGDKYQERADYLSKMACGVDPLASGYHCGMGNKAALQRQAQPGN